MIKISIVAILLVIFQFPFPLGPQEKPVTFNIDGDKSVNSRISSKSKSKIDSVFLFNQNNGYGTISAGFLAFMAMISMIYLMIHIRFIGLSRRKEVKEKLTREISELHLQLLQSQMNPHFVFNSLNSVQNFILSNKIPEAANYLSAMGKLIRLNLENVSAEAISLADEVIFLGLFINIEKLRFKEALEVALTNSIEKNGTIFLPPMLIQPLVENSIKYGCRSGKQVRTIKIDFGMKDGLLIASVTDNGIGRDRSLEEHDPGHKSVGLSLIKERLDLLNKKYNTHGYQIVITDLYQGEIPIGTKVQVTVPQFGGNV